jgi:ketosteroid isomerase-like protein
MSGQPTKPELSERVRLGEQAFNRRDFDGAVVFCKADAVWDASPVGLGVYEGRDAIRGFFEDWLGSYEDFEQASTEFCDLGNGVTFDVKRQRGRLAGSSEFVELRFAVVMIWMDGSIERMLTYTDIDQARTAAERLAEERA